MAPTGVLTALAMSKAVATRLGWGACLPVSLSLLLFFLSLAKLTSAATAAASDAARA